MENLKICSCLISALKVDSPNVNMLIWVNIFFERTSLKNYFETQVLYKETLVAKNFLKKLKKVVISKKLCGFFSETKFTKFCTTFDGSIKCF